MRITRIQLVGLAAALVGASARDASANDVTISTPTTAPVVTASPDGVSPGDVTIAAGGSITVTTGQTAVTVNTSNDVTNNGTLAATDANNTTGIRIQGGNTGIITNTSAINLLENYTLADTNADGDLDGEFAIGTNRNGIFLQAGPTFTGNIINSGAISVEGENSAAIRLDALLTGDLNSTGGVTVTGDNSIGVAINGGAAGGVSGDVFVRGNVNAIGENSAGLVVGAPIGGELRINGAWSVTGFHTINRPANVSALDPDDLLLGGSAIAVHYSVAGGVTIEGIGVEDDLDDDGDGLLDGTAAEINDDFSAAINSFGSSPAILIQAAPSANLALGATASGYGLHVRGAVVANGVYDNINATAIRVEGVGAGSTVTTAAGIAIDSNVAAAAFEADATGLYVGANATVPIVLVRRQLTGVVSAETAQNAYALAIGLGANVAAVTNSGTMRAQLFGEVGSATVILDQSNSLATITNSGTIQAQVIATDANPLDNIPPPAITGSAVAIDVSASSIGVTLNQVADTPFTDDDTVDNDLASRPAVMIAGEIRFGSGVDRVNLLAGSITGNLSFGAGADTLFINNGATYFGRLSDSDGALAIDVANGALALNGGTVNITSAHFGADGEFGFLLSQTPGQSTLVVASGTVTFDAGAVLAPIVPGGLPASGTHTFLTANSLLGASNVTGVIVGAGAPFLYNLNVGLVAGDPNSLEASYLLKTPTQLGLNVNQSAAFNNIIGALQLDADASAALAALDTASDFADAYEDLMPSYASGAAELAATAIQQAQGAASNRLSATRLHDLDEVSAWAQEIGYGVDRQPPTANGQEFRGQGFGIAVGVDGPLESGDMFGLAASFIASELEEPGRPEGEISAWFGQLNAYLGTAMGPIDLDLVAGAGVGKMQSRRFVEIGSTFRALSEADWWAYEGHGSVRASLPLRLSDWMVITPQAALTYVALSEGAYTEGGGGGAIDYDVDDAFSQRLWGDVGMEFSARFNMGGGAIVAPRLFAGYRANLIDEEAERTFRFTSGGSDFTLTDDGLGDGAPLVGIGIDTSNGFSTFSLAYEGEYGDQIERHSLNASIRFKF